MPQVKITVNGLAYTVACREGEEDQVKALGRMVADKVETLAREVGQVGENKLLLMAALLLADELADRDGGRAVDSRDAASGIIDSAAARIEDIVARLENA